jgi:macrolide-specific efflux system membrane fusion protein
MTNTQAAQTLEAVRPERAAGLSEEIGRQMRLKLAALVLLLAVGVGAVAYAAFGLGTARPSTSQYLTAQVARQDVVDQVVATGSLSASASYDLSFGAAPTESTGSASSNSGGSSVVWDVSAVDVAVGDRVAKDQVLAEATSADLEAQIADASRALSTATIQLSIAETAVGDATTTAQLRQAKVSRYQAQTQQGQAQRQLDDLKAMRQWNVLKAPADGVVTAVALRPGQEAPGGAALSMDAATLQTVGDVVESDLTRVAVGQAAAVTVPALGVDVPGTVSAVAPSAASTNGSSVVTFAVTVTLSDPPPAARVGMSARVAITVAQASNALAVPIAALNGTTGSYEVRVLTAEGLVTTRQVSVGLITTSLAEITSGVSEGETVITGTSTQRTTTGGGGGFGGGFGGGGTPIVVPGGQP